MSNDWNEADALIGWKDPLEGKRRWPWGLLALLAFVAGFLVRGFVP